MMILMNESYEHVLMNTRIYFGVWLFGWTGCEVTDGRVVRAGVSVA